MIDAAMIPAFRAQFDSRWLGEPNSGCWLWTGNYTGGPHPRPTLTYRGRTVSATRLSHVLHIGEIPDGFYVCHRCDTPACVNPAHLFSDTQTGNMRDAVAKGRMPRGSRINHAKLTERAALEIKLSSEQTKFLAERHGVTRSVIRHIRSGLAWRHVTPLVTSGEGKGDE